MLYTFVLTALAAALAVLAQDVTYRAIRCTPRFGSTSTAAVPTWYRLTTTNNIFRSNTTTRETIVVTPSATTFTDVLITTSIVLLTTTSTPAATTVPTSAGFIPLLYADLASPTPIPRIKRHDLDAPVHLLKRQTSVNNTGGFSVDRNGSTSNIFNRFPRYVICRVSFTINSTKTEVVTGLTGTVIAAAATATALSMVTVVSTSTVLEVALRPMVYAACQRNNVGEFSPAETMEYGEVWDGMYGLTVY
jgi:hypothetical protein